MTTKTILDAVHTAFGVPPDQLREKRKYQNVAEARFAAAYLMATEAGMRHKDINSAFGKRHPWASHAILRCQDQAETDKRYAAKVLAAYTMVKGAAA